MSKAYANVNSSTGTFAGWLSKSNELFYDMSTIIVTVADVAAPNNSNASRTTGNADVQGYFSANNMIVWDTLSGGQNEDWTDTATLYIVSNTQIGNSSQTDTLEVYGDTTFYANVTIGSDTADDLTIESNTNINGQAYFHANAQFDDGDYLKFGTGGDVSVQWNGSDLFTRFQSSNANFIIEDVSGNDVIDIDIDSSTLTIARYDDETGGPSLVLLDEGTTLDSNTVGGIFFKGQDSGSAVTEYAYIRGIAEDNTNATEDGSLTLYTTIDSTRTAMIAINEASDAAVSLRYDGSEKLATTATGVSVTGVMASTTATTSGLATLDSLDVTNDAVINGDLTIQGDFLATGSTNMTVNTATFTTMTVIGSTELGDSASDTLTISATVSANSDIVPAIDSTYDLGSDGNRFALAYVDDATVTSNVNIQNAGHIKFYDTDSSNFVAFKSAGTVASNVTWTLPNEDASVSGYSLQSNGSGALSWGPAGATTTSDTSTNAEEQLYFGDITSGAVTDVHHDAGLTYNPFLGRITTASANVVTLSLNGTAVTSTATELNLLDGVTSTTAELNIVDGSTAATSTTLANADRLIVNDAGTMKQVALTDFNTYFTSTFLTGGSADIKTSGDLTFNDNVAINLGTDEDVEIYHDGSHMRVDINTGGLYLRDGTNSNATAFAFTPTSASLLLANYDAAGSGPEIILRHDSASPAASDEIGQIFFQGDDSGGTNTDYAYIDARIVDPTNTSEDGSLLIYAKQAGSDSVHFSANSGVTTLYHNGNAKIATNSGGVTITGTATATTFSGALSGNASTATKWATGRTIALTGDVTGTSGSFDGSGNLSFSTNIASNVVGASELNVSGNGTTSQFLRSDGDGSFSWVTPTNTTYSAGNGITLSSTTFSVAAGGGLTQDSGGLSHSNTSSVSNLGASSRRYVTALTFDTYGHVTGYSTGTETVVDTNTTYSAGTGMSLSGTTFSIGQSVGTGNNVRFNSLGIGTSASGTTGEIRATNNITAYYSDKRLKDDITPIANALDKIVQIRGVTYRSNDIAKEHGFENDELQYGVIAQEVEAIMPEIVVPAPFDIEQNEETGEEYSKTGENYKTVQYEKMIPLLIEAIKELKQEIDSLKKGN